MNFCKYLQISRPGLWFLTLWMYLAPFDITSHFWEWPSFWLGAFFVTFPLNFMAYGLNDFTNFRSDSINPRKGNYLFGSRLSRNELAPIPKVIFFVMLPFLVLFPYLEGTDLFVLLLFMIVVKIFSDYKPFRLRERPPLDILIQTGYVFVVLFSILLNDLPMLPWQTFLFLMVFAFMGQTMGGIMDIEPDTRANVKSTTIWLGRKGSKFLLIFLALFEAFILKFWFDDNVLSMLMVLFAVWMVLDVLFFFKNKPYSVPQMKAFGILINLVGLISLAWALKTGTLLHSNF